MAKATLAELMGAAPADKAKQGRKLGLDDLHHILGEKMPKLDFTPVGRLRLTSALRNRFGDGYRNVSGVSDIMEEFDKHSKFEVLKAKMRMIKPGK